MFSFTVLSFDFWITLIALLGSLGFGRGCVALCGGTAGYAYLISFLFIDCLGFGFYLIL